MASIVIFIAAIIIFISLEFYRGREIKGVKYHIDVTNLGRYYSFHAAPSPNRIRRCLFEEDSYQLQLSRYIHRNPIEAGVVNWLENYAWSSYPYNVSKLSAPEWLHRDEIYQQLSVNSRQREKYRAFVELGVDDEIAAFYGKDNQSPYLGSDAFRD
ncbi:MAG: hypothetical protein PVJ39_09765 [Gammaproteobacteria bacterium]|jgi:hypothetical protein